MPQSDKGFTDSLKDAVSSIKKKVEQQGFTKRGPDIAALILALAGVIITFFSVQWGAILLGVALGLTFYDEIISFLRGIKYFINKNGVNRVVILAALLVFFLIALPGGVIATLITVLVRSLIPESNDIP